MPIRDILLAILVVALWGFNFVVIKVGVAEIPPLFLTGLRYLFAAIPLIFFIRRPATSWSNIVGYGLSLGVLMFGLLFVGMKLGVNASMSSIIPQLQVFFTMGFAALLLGEKPKAWQILGAIIAFSGIAIMGAERIGGSSFLPFMLLVLGAVFWGLANIIAKKAGQIDMFAFTVWTSIVPIAPLLLISWMFEDRAAIIATITTPTALGVGTVLYQAYPATIIGFAIWNQLLKKHPAGLVAPFSLLVPIFGVLSGVFVLGETMSTLAIIGGIVIFFGLALNVFGERVFSARFKKYRQTHR